MACDPPHPHKTWAEFYCSLPANPHQKINAKRDQRPDYDLLADIAREEAHDRYVEMGERQRYGY